MTISRLIKALCLELPYAADLGGMGEREKKKEERLVCVRKGRMQIEATVYIKRPYSEQLTDFFTFFVLNSLM
jgi:hypothetical protein